MRSTPKRLVHVLHPHYIMVQRKYLTETVIPMMYVCVEDDIVTRMQTAERVCITCDTWTSLSTQSYMTVTSVHFHLQFLYNFKIALLKLETVLFTAEV